MNCVVCGLPVDPAVVTMLNPTHPTCLGSPYEDLAGDDPFAVMLKSKLISMIRWADEQNPRSQQQALGPSEIGDPCDRRMGYRLAGVPSVNTGADPWAAIVGTAMHAWLDDAVSLWCAANDSADWSTETTLSINQFVEGHSDLYNHPLRTVIDWKGAGPSVMKKVKSSGPSAGYQVQTHIYGYGFEQKGWPVERVCLVFLPRAGRLVDMFVWSAPYDRRIAIAALKRPPRVAHELISNGILIDGNGHMWENIKATPTSTCGFCPWYSSTKEPGEGANERGCPGK